MNSLEPIHSIRRWARNSPWLVMSIAVHAILLVSLGLVVMKTARRAPPAAPETVNIRTKLVEEPIFVPPEEYTRSTRDIIPPEMDQEVVTPDEMTDIPPDPTVIDEDLTKPIGDPLGNDIDATLLMSSSATGAGDGPGQFGDGPTTTFGRNRRLGFEGGTGRGGRPPKFPLKPTDKAVLEGLRWLARHQNPDGSWGARSLKDRCDPEHPCFDPKASLTEHYDEGLTGLALLGFLGAGFSNRSNQSLVDPVGAKRYRIGDIVKHGLEWLAKRQNPDGSFTRDRAFMYNDALATMAMSEAYGLTRNRYWGDPAQRGVDFLQNAQRPNPSGTGLWGWRYQSRQELEDFRKGTGDPASQKELFDSDTSVTTWCVMALKSAQLSDLRVKPESMEGAMEFCKFVTANDGLVGYLDAKGAGIPVSGPNDHFTYHTGTMSALGMCIRTFTKHDASDPFLELGAKRLLADLPTISKDKLSIDYYYWYYASIALNQFDGDGSPRSTGKYWNPWNKAMVASLLSLQDGNEHTCSRGGWITGDRWSYTGGPLYATAINVLTLEVYYRYENAFGGVKRN